MKLLDYLRHQFTLETMSTRKYLSLVPMEKATWKPHEKSMELGRLANHLADLPSWVELALTSEELDFQNNIHPEPFSDTLEGILENFDKSVKIGLDALTEENTKLFPETWIMRNGEQVLWDTTKLDVIRVTISQLTHHRAQLGVYLRLNNIAIPAVYGPTADEAF